MHWNNDDLLARLQSDPGGFEIGIDNDGQVLIYTGLREVNGELESFETESDHRHNTRDTECSLPDHHPGECKTLPLPARNTWENLSQPIPEK